MDVIAQTDAFFCGRMKQWALFQALVGEILGLWPSAQMRVMKTCIAFDDPKPFCYVSFPKRKEQEGLIVSISLREDMRHPRFDMVVPVSKSRFTAHIHLADESCADAELMELIALSRR